MHVECDARRRYSSDGKLPICLAVFCKALARGQFPKSACLLLPRAGCAPPPPPPPGRSSPRRPKVGAHTQVHRA
ncbi:hypothetical protein CEXT_678991 [Caerostris extrusa]|uniref:Uncharacterized protein n=1 Tax=Caerostris extrusa TaxID=172846 RepID=A0AAV4NBV2_CAEEX|nr:hypothetical protein CEXT_678991 [Caerostris extrusa]